MKVVVYQTPLAKCWHGKNWGYARQHRFSTIDYYPVYEEDYTPDEDIIDTYLDCLAHIHQLLNYTPPATYKGEKLNFGDVLEIDGTKYYIDYAGLHNCEGY